MTQTTSSDDEQPTSYRPAAGRRVRYPGSNQLLANEGAVLTLTPYWRRLLLDGDIVEVPVVTTGKAKTSTKTDSGSAS